MAAAKGNNYSALRKNNKTYTDDEIDVLCEELLDFAENHKSIFFVKFCRMKGFSRQWLLNLCEHHSKLKETYSMARELMASKVGDLCFYDKESGVNANFGKDNLFRYDDEWVAHLKWKADIQKEQPREAENKCAFNEWSQKQKCSENEPE